MTDIQQKVLKAIARHQPIHESHIFASLPYPSREIQEAIDLLILEGAIERQLLSGILRVRSKGKRE